METLIAKAPVQARRRMPIGADVLPQGGVEFRVWAPRRRRVEVVFEDAHRPPPPSVVLQPEENGYFIGRAGVVAGTRYRFRLDDGEKLFPDPASRFQPEGPHGPSQVVDPGAFKWTDARWRGVPTQGQAIYEMHVGTFTHAGTYAAAMEELPALKDLGVTVIELLPLADFSGRFGWGYDGVNMFAPTRLYGEPDDLRRFIDRAHGVGLGVILDVVYNHFGPDGNYLRDFSDDYISTIHSSEWGDAPNFDGRDCAPVREFFVANATYWIDEFHFDGYRLDATQQISDDSDEHIVAAVTRAAQRAARGRAVYIVAENEPQQTRLLAPREQGGYAIDALWNDDFHHSAIVALTGRREAYYSDHRGTPQEFISAAKYGFLYQGQYYEWQRNPRGTPSLTLPPHRFVTFLENHDQLANSGLGLRCHMQTSPGRYRAMAALLLLGPQTPMLFQGQEFAASTPFFYFADHREDLARAVHEGRTTFLSQFPSLATREVQNYLPDPTNPETFVRSKLDLNERHTHTQAYALHRDLLQLRHSDAIFGRADVRIDGAVLGAEAFVLRFFGEAGDDRLLIVNLGIDLQLVPAPEPLLAPPSGRRWQLLWSSENPRYGGRGTPSPEGGRRWQILGHSALALYPVSITEDGHE